MLHAARATPPGTPTLGQRRHTRSSAAGRLVARRPGMSAVMTYVDRPQSLPRRFSFAFDRRFMPPLALLGVMPPTASVTVDERDLTVRFGPWRLQTPRDNIVN